MVGGAEGRISCWLRKGWLHVELHDRQVVLRLQLGRLPEQVEVFTVDWDRVLPGRDPTQDDVVLDPNDLTLTLGRKVKVKLSALVDCSPPL